MDKVVGGMKRRELENLIVWESFVNCSRKLENLVNQEIFGRYSGSSLFLGKILIVSGNQVWAYQRHSNAENAEDAEILVVIF